MRIRIPVPPALQLPLAIAGGVILLAMYFLIARALIAQDRRAGWAWLAGTLLTMLFALAVLFVFGQQAQGFEPLYASIGFVALTGIGAVLLLRRAGWPRMARWIAGLGALSLVAKLVIEPVLLMVRIDGEVGIAPAPFTDPGNLMFGALIVIFAWLALGRPRKRQAATFHR